ncbi:MAG: glycosyltransferase family protein [Alphaproteobacteria bacterium]|nr:glycosyltransferase family protein [Alphaproteobacteria bacterium]
MSAHHIDTPFAEALAAHQAGRLDEARRGYDDILQGDPLHAGALHLLGVLSHQSGHAAGAIDLVRRAVDVKPDYAEAHANLGVILQAAGHLAEAEESLRNAVVCDPGSAQHLTCLGVASQANGKAAEAAFCHRHALRVDAGHADAWSNWGIALKSLGQLDEAERAYRRALALRPGHADALVNLGTLLEARDRLDEAVDCWRQALDSQPGHADAWSNLGSALQALDRPDEAVAAYDRALALASQHPEAHWNRGLALLSMGRFREGWRDYEWRWRRPDMLTQAREFLQPPWMGQPLDGETVLLHAEQGLGDTIQFVRFARAARRLCGRVTLECQPALERLLAGGVAGIDSVVAAGRTVPPFDAQAPLLSLPRLLGVAGPADIPAEPAYLRPPGPLPERLRLPPAPFRVGLVWQGSPAFAFNHVRCFPFATLRPLLDLPGIAFHGLQMGPAAAEREPPVTDLAPLIGDMGDTAHLLAQLDLVIGVDTGVIHLAGALGRPTWVMLSRAPDFRWLEDRDDCPWYPGARLFRQPRRGDWAAVVRAVRAALVRLHPMG